MAHLVQYTCTIAHQGLSDAALSTYYTYLKSASSLSNLLFFPKPAEICDSKPAEIF